MKKTAPAAHGFLKGSTAGFIKEAFILFSLSRHSQGSSKKTSCHNLTSQTFEKRRIKSCKAQLLLDVSQICQLQFVSTPELKFEKCRCPSIFMMADRVWVLLGKKKDSWQIFKVRVKHASQRSIWCHGGWMKFYVKCRFEEESSTSVRKHLSLPLKIKCHLLWSRLKGF